MPLVNILNVPTIMNQEIAWILSTAIPVTPVFVQEVRENKIFEWHPLYISAIHGFSFSVFEQRCFDYPGATLLLAHDVKGLLFGVYNSKDWKTQKRFIFSF